MDAIFHSDYRRIVGGLAWPGTAPGFALVLGEETRKDGSFEVHHLHVLAEAEGSTARKLLTRCREFQDQFGKLRFYGDNRHPLLKFLRVFNSELATIRQPTIDLMLPPEFDAGDEKEDYPVLYAELIKNRIAGQKTLHLGDESALPEHLSALQSPETFKPEHNPALAALMFAVAEIDMRKPTEIFYPNRTRLRAQGRY